MLKEPDTPVVFLTAASAGLRDGMPCAVAVRSREEFMACLHEPPSGAQWLQVEGLLGDPEVWAAAAQGASLLPLDVILTDPAAEYSALYRLVDVRMVRPVRVTIPAVPGFMKALRLAAAIQLPVRLLPGQPRGEAMNELMEAAEFYLHDGGVEAPIEPFHSVLTGMRNASDDTLWRILEEDPETCDRSRVEGNKALPGNSVNTFLAELVARGAECADCHWRTGCAGYFKWPDPAYACAGVKKLLSLLEAAAEEIEFALAVREASAC